MRGGFGQAGKFRHKKSSVIRNKELIGKKGFTSIAQKSREGGTLNVSQLSEMVDKLVVEKKAQLENEKVVVDLGQLGFKKLLGVGSLSRPVRVKVDHCSESALKKIQEAGGEAILSSPAK